MPKLDDWVVPIGKARVARVGTMSPSCPSHWHDLCPCGGAKLAAEGIEAEIIDLRSIARWTWNRAGVGAQDQPPASAWRMGFPRFSVTSNSLPKS